jgi:4-diphosphocytidyl-2-C-methyl-D-erythritol kinase
MHIRRLGAEVVVYSPAKVNLHLEVLGQRPDGYHEIETVLVAVTLYDTLTFVARDDPKIDVTSRWASGFTAQDRAAPAAATAAAEPLAVEIPAGDRNLVWRAAALLQQRSGCQLGAAIGLVKRIPAAAGLGGASSDAAATLFAANTAWRLDWPRERLAELAAELGSDVPFFLTRGAAVCRGRGEQIEAIPARRLHLVIARPPIGLSTPRVYKECKPTPAPRGAGPLVAALRAGDAASVGRHLGNGLTAPAARLTPWIKQLAEEFDSQGLLGHQMSGSGASYFGLCNSARHARRIAARLRARGRCAVFPVETAIAN